MAKAVCIKCGSEAVTRDALVAWDAGAEDWVVQSILDNGDCAACGNSGNNVIEFLEDDSTDSPGEGVTKGMCMHCRAPVRLIEGVWVHDDPDEDPKDEFYGHAKCLPDGDGNFNYAEPREI